ncbi:hypothetical protein ACLMJK_002144 [Lecanora helva]
MASQHILRIPRSDSVEDFVIVYVSSRGSSSLDLELLATEGEHPYETTIKHSRISKLRDKRSDLTKEQWEQVLLSSLLQQPAQKVDKELEILASIRGGNLTIQIRKNISGITQKLGEINLKENEAQEIDAIGWCGIAVQRSTNLEAEVLNLRTTYEEQSETIRKLNKELEELVEAKKTHEETLLQRFRELLNSKKIKIRDQQRVLATAKVDPAQVEKVNNTRRIPKARAAAASRDSKRKAEEAASESSEEESFENKPPTQKDEINDSDQANTPEPSDQDATEDESDNDLASAPHSNLSLGKNKASKSGAPKQETLQTDTPPPSRELPFGNPDKDTGLEKGAGPGIRDASTLNQEAGNEDEETDDDDDEL